MVSTRVKALFAALMVDALAAAWIFLVNDQLLTWWMLANAVAIPAVIITVLLRRKKRAAKLHRASFSEHQKMHGPEHKTMNGEVVKSGGERMIADYFHRNKIRYEYERSAMGASNRRISRPDFYLPDYDVYVEYWGMVDTQDSKKKKEYVKGMEWKMARYRDNNIRFVSIYPQEIASLNSVFKKKLKEATGMDLD